MVRLLRLLMIGYATAAFAATLAFWGGWGGLTAALVFWLGGALVVSVLAVVQAKLTRAEAEPAIDDGADEAALLARALDEWERDRLSDRPAQDKRAL